MHRFYISSQNISGDKISILDKKIVHHIKDVLRLKVGDEVTIFDGRGNACRSIIEKLLPKTVVAKIEDRQKFIPPEKIRTLSWCST